MTLHRITLPTATPTLPGSVGLGSGGEGDGRCAPAALEVLDSDIYRDMRWCSNCGGEQVFVEVYEFESGRMGVCWGCGEERVIPFTRTNSEGE